MRRFIGGGRAIVGVLQLAQLGGCGARAARARATSVMSPTNEVTGRPQEEFGQEAGLGVELAPDAPSQWTFALAGSAWATCLNLNETNRPMPRVR